MRAVLVIDSTVVRGRKVLLKYASVEAALDDICVAKLSDGVVGWDLKGLGYRNGEEEEQERSLQRRHEPLPDQRAARGSIEGTLDPDPRWGNTRLPSDSALSPQGRPIEEIIAECEAFIREYDEKYAPTNKSLFIPWVGLILGVGCIIWGIVHFL
jgi:hypothetical protein